MNFDLSAIEPIITVISIVIGGFFAVLYFIGTNARANREENDRITSELIKNLTTTVDQQKIELDLVRAHMRDHTIQRDAEVKDLAEKLNHLQGRNSLLEEIFKGRDPVQEKVFSQALEVFEIARANNKISTSNGEAIAALTSTMNEFIKKLDVLLLKQV